MKFIKLTMVVVVLSALLGCSNGKGFTPCYSLPPAEQAPGINCIPNGGGGAGM